MTSKTVDIIDKFGEWGTSDEFNLKLDMWMEVSQVFSVHHIREDEKKRRRTTEKLREF